MAASWAVLALATAAAWALRAAVWACLVSSAMLVAEAAYMGAASLVAAVAPQRFRPRRRYRWEPMPGGDVEARPEAEFPMVLVQIPMYNEREVRRPVHAISHPPAPKVMCVPAHCPARVVVVHFAVARRDREY